MRYIEICSRQLSKKDIGRTLLFRIEENTGAALEPEPPRDYRDTKQYICIYRHSESFIFYRKSLLHLLNCMFNVK